jgi:hypothetical protein
MLRRAITVVVFTLSFLTNQARSEHIALSVNLIVTAQEATSIGRATYDDTGLCLDCRMHGNHRINGGTASYSWDLYPTEVYERQLNEPVRDAACYTAFIEGWGQAGFYGSLATVQKCAPCVLGLDTYGSGSISGAPTGVTSYDCGERISVTATPASGWEFDHWNGSITSQSTSLSFTLDASKSLTAFFLHQPPPPPPPPDGGGNGCEGGRVLNIAEDCSPIVFNFASGDYRLTGRNSPVLFDMPGNGHPRLMGWTAAGADEAFLWLDRNHNGKVTSGAELFGNFTPLQNGRLAINGFEALAEYDANHDGILDDLDPIWSRLMLWRDLNHNGLSEPNEISPLDTSDVTGIHLHEHWTGRNDSWGNAFRYESLISIRNRSGRGVRKQPVYDIFFVSVP